MTDVVKLNTAPAEAKAGFCMTPTAQLITDVLATCRDCGWIGVIAGNPGVGKTSAATDFAQSNPDVYFCRMTRTAARLQPGLVRIGAVLSGIVQPTMGANAVQDEIIHRLDSSTLSDYPRKMLVIDEA